MLERVEFHPRLVEEAVFAALRGRPESRTFHRERDPIYREADPEERERRFAALHAAWFERLDLAAAARSRCPLCGFPSARFEPRPEDLPRAVRDAIRADFPGWIEADGLCPQCADLYRARPLSRGAADLLPGRAIL